MLHRVNPITALHFLIKMPNRMRSYCAHACQFGRTRRQPPSFPFRDHFRSATGRRAPVDSAMSTDQSIDVAAISSDSLSDNDELDIRMDTTSEDEGDSGMQFLWVLRVACLGTLCALWCLSFGFRMCVHVNKLRPSSNVCVPTNDRLLIVDFVLQGACG